MKVLIERKSTASSHYLNLPDHVELLSVEAVECGGQLCVAGVG